MDQDGEHTQGTARRSFIVTGLKMAALAGISGWGLLSSCGGGAEEGQKVSPPEDLMQEHGLLNRILLVYDACKGHLQNGTGFPVEALFRSASIIRTFVEDYHERQEENYLFPRFRKAHTLVGLVDVLLQQHQAGRRVTDQILQLSRGARPDEHDRHRLIDLLGAFNSMYRPHESREDTVLFPAFRKIVSRHEYDALGEEFERNEHRLFGKDGFQRYLDQVSAIERSLGIGDLARFTPAI